MINGFSCGVGDEMFVFYKAARFFLAPLFKILFRPRIIGRENIPYEGPAVIAGNHKHALDPILIDVSTKRVVRTLAKKELHDSFFGFFFRSAGTIPVDLHAKSNPLALEAAIEALRWGQLVNVSPEAKRNYTDELLLKFKYGASVMSNRTGAVIVPYAISGDYSFFSHHRLTVIFGKPINPEDDPDHINKKLYNDIAGLLKRTMPSEELRHKHITSYEGWKTNEKTS